MKKEVLIAIVSGLILGLIITLGIYTANKSLEQQKAKKQAENQAQVTPTPPSNLNQNKTLNITSHQSFDLINQSGITLSGVAWPEAVVALITENNQFITQADTEGIFNFKFNLIKGFNEIALIAADETNTTQTQNLVLTYSTTEVEIPE